MPLASAYYRPHSINEAVTLLADKNRVALAGGTIVNADRTHAGIELVDLQALGLSGISAEAGRVAVGAMTTLSALADADLISGELQAIARAELPSTLRTRATVGGTVAAMRSDSVLAAALLASDGRATVVDSAGEATAVTLADLFSMGPRPQRLITAVEIAAGGTLALASTGRTPADVPIVAAVAHRLNGTTTVALTGVAATPVIVDPENPTVGLEPPGDFRGSSHYRRQLAATLTRRALEVLS